MAVTQLGLFQLRLVELKSERLLRDLLVRLGQVDFHESEGSSHIRFGGAHTHQQLIPLRTTPPHGAQLPQQSRQLLPPHRHLFGLPSFTLGQYV